MGYRREEFGGHPETEKCDALNVIICSFCFGEVCPCGKLYERLEGKMCQQCSDELDRVILFRLRYHEWQKRGQRGERA